MAAASQPVLIFFLIAVSAFHQTLSKPNGFSLKLIPRDSPESPLYPGNLTTLERIERLIEFSRARARYVELTSSPNATILYPENIRLTLLRDNFFYTVQVGVGTPATGVFLLLDTGGGLIWTQCLPCLNCYPQRTPMFDSSKSSTYQKLPCSHRFCQGDRPLYKCVNDECVYNINYGGGASTAGIASMETFTFPVDTATTTRIGQIVFGCSKYSRNVQFAKGGVISGVMGLSLSPDSLASQLSDVTQKRFSYCLVPFTQAQQAPSLVRFGDDIPHPSSNIQTTPFVPTPGSHYFQLNLLDISVGFRKLGFPPGTFTARPDGSGGCIVDSGALIPQIDQNAQGGRNAYRQVMSAFQSYYNSFQQLTRIGKVPQGFALCYKYPQDFNQFTSMTYHFEDADYIVDPKYVNFYDQQGGYFCVALLPGNGKSILGAWHQQNMRVTYDGNINSLQFSVETCSYDV
ncbi:aspartic proteinase nepenthesin-1-like [Rosa rugosa]|uniref:aspartic proteinase nepenthesin-1-like n=1 Tax=Rosa rugosa TaxID=74645 RepID=UPI002B40E09F|nr:aspartic proteinase nepenthesin-1-like [Rosa rugosa]